MIFSEIDDSLVSSKRIKVIGVGGGGGNAIDHMIDNNVGGVEFYAVNTDAVDLRNSRASNKLLIGKTRTHGQGAGQNPEVGRAAALESEDDIREMIGDAEMVFITCGMGGGTGTGAAPVIARIAKEHGCLTIGVCTKPFLFEGPIRADNAFNGLKEINEYADCVIVIPNQRLLSICDKGTTLIEAYREVNTVLRKAVQGVAEIIAIPAHINVDLADVRTVMTNKGTALLGIGSAKGRDRAVEAARAAIHSRLLEVNIEGATHAIVNIVSSEDVSMIEVDTIMREIRNCCNKNLNIIYGHAFNSDLKDEIVVTVIATGFEDTAKDAGIEDFSDLIFRNFEEQNIILVTDEDDENLDIDVQEDKMEDLFGEGKTAKQKAREEKQRLKEEKQRQKEEAKRKKEEEKQAKNLSSSSNQSLPDWLKRK